MPNLLSVLVPFNFLVGAFALFAANYVRMNLQDALASRCLASSVTPFAVSTTKNVSVVFCLSLRCRKQSRKHVRKNELFLAATYTVCFCDTQLNILEKCSRASFSNLDCGTISEPNISKLASVVATYPEPRYTRRTMTANAFNWAANLKCDQRHEVKGHAHGYRRHS